MSKRTIDKLETQLSIAITIIKLSTKRITKLERALLSECNCDDHTYGELTSHGDEVLELECTLTALKSTSEN